MANFESLTDAENETVLGDRYRRVKIVINMTSEVHTVEDPESRNSLHGHAGELHWLRTARTRRAFYMHPVELTKIPTILPGRGLIYLSKFLKGPWHRSQEEGSDTLTMGKSNYNVG